jgi:glucose/arabinose dehydrogenase
VKFTSTKSGEKKMKRFKRNCGILGVLFIFLAMCGLIFTFAGCSTMPAATGATAGAQMPTPQQVAAYAAPWLQAAASVANSLQAAGVIDQAKNITSAEAVANAALVALNATPTAANAASLQTAMVPVYQLTKSNSSPPAVSGGKQQ